MKQAVALALAVCLTLTSTPIAFAQSAAAAAATQPGGDPWPRTVTVTGTEISIYQPQLNSWNGNLLDAYSAVKVKVSGSDVTNYGVIWFTARTEVDKVNRVVTLNDFTLTKQSFPTLPDSGIQGRGGVDPEHAARRARDGAGHNVRRRGAETHRREQRSASDHFFDDARGAGID
jgi:hypothetical protein